VKKSKDGRQFESISRIASNNRADLQSAYSYVDNVPNEGVVYYRLAMVDKDGSIAYSKIVVINFANSKFFVIDNVKVSASSSNLRIHVSTSQSQILNYAIIDVNGRIITAKNMQLQIGSNNIVTDIPAINKGIYYVKMQTSDASITKAVLSE